jgi:aminoglycoside phosphotransferase family enzyme/predicted kinase
VSPRRDPDDGDGGGDPYADVAETHTGVVLFVGERAYKLKKPVAFPFLDNRTLAARRRCCADEVELNRRLAPDVYLGVGEIVEPDGGGGEPIVVMRRLPASRRLSRLLAAGVDVRDDLRRIAHRVAALHASQEPAAPEPAGLEATRRRWHDNATELRQLADRPTTRAAGDAVAAAADRYLAGRARLFERRIADGWCRDGHGDLLADDIFCLDDGPRILDCLEFDPGLRVGDVLADVAFLAMDLERLGRPDLGWWFLELHRDLLHDRWPPSLAHHHIAYRAQVRAKVACARHRQGGDVADAEDDAARLLQIAARHLHDGRVRLIVIGGLPATGKSTLAAAIGADLDAVVLRSDEIRKRLVGLAANAHAPAAPGTGIYDERTTAVTYDELLREARALLELGHSVVLDASFADDAPRHAAQELADAVSAELSMLRCVAPVAVTAGRLAARQREGADPSDADLAVAVEMATRFAPWPAAVDVDTTGDPAVTLAAARRALQEPPWSC